MSAIVLLAVATAACGGGSSSRDAQATTTQAPPAPAGRSISGPFDPAKALQLIYGAYDPQSRSAAWTPSVAEVKQHELKDTAFDPGPTPVTVLSTYEFVQQGVEHRLMVTKAAPPNFDCHACAPLLGAFLFKRAGEAWVIAIETPIITAIGAWGEPPEIELARVGADHQGLLVHAGFTAQGTTEESTIVIADVDGHFAEVFQAPTSGNNGGACGTDGGDTGCYSYESTLEFQAGPTSSFSDIVVKTTGTDIGDEGKVVSVARTTTYRFSNGKYTEEH